MTTEKVHYAKWSMAVDADRCTGCQACVVACQAENNIPLNTEDIFKQKRAMVWIRIERYWEAPPEYMQLPQEPKDAPFDTVKARFLPLLCQHCENAPCEPVCPVFATYHNPEGLNVQVYNRCIGTRYCANNDPYNVRFFNWWEPVWPDTFRNYLNPDVTVRSRGVMEKCTFCVQRIRRVELAAKKQDRLVEDGEVQPACVQACPTNALVFGDIKRDGTGAYKGRPIPESKVHKLSKSKRGYRLLEQQGTEPNIVYLKKVDPNAQEGKAHG